MSVLKTTLYDYQQRAHDSAIQAMKSDGYFGLLMEMGTGKTLTTLAIYETMARAGLIDSMVVIAPKALLSTWEVEIEKHIGNVKVFRYDSTRWAQAGVQKEVAEWVRYPARIALVNVEAFQLSVPPVAGLISRCLLTVDESSKIKNPQAQRTKNLWKVAPQASYRLILTGTEITNSPLDVYGQFEFLKAGIFGFRSFFMFKNYYAVLMDKYGSGGRTFKDVVGYRHLDQLQSIVDAHSFRALKKDCLSLPEKIVSPIYVDPTPEQKRLMKELKRDCMTMLEQGELTVLNRATLFGKFRQIVGGTVITDDGVVRLKDNPKIQALIDDVEDTDEQAIIWAAHVEEVKIIAEALAPLGQVALFYGGMAQDRREVSIRSFQEGQARFFVGTPQSGAYGLNLQHCALMYYYSRPTSPTDNWQSADRIHRAGQTRSCVYKPIIMRGTVDIRIEQLLAEKTDVLSAFQTGTLSEFMQNMGVES